jgi:hypothetical protein
MMLAFPNACRSFDPSRRIVRFWGHESTLEFAFFIDESALRRLDPGLDASESGFIRTFDDHLPAIHLAATRAHARGRHLSYSLTAADFAGVRA